MRSRGSFDWKAKKVLVTGAGGFIGSHLCEELVAQGADVTAVVRYTSRSDWGNLEFLSPDLRKNIRVVTGNIEDASFVLRHVKGKDVVFHLAALIGIPYSYVAPISYLRTNVEGTLNVMEACLAAGVEKVVHTSTSEAYGTALYVPIDEKHPLQAQSPYSASKISADKVAESFHRSFSLPVATLRPFNTYGPRQSARAVIPTIISQAHRHAEIKLGTLTPVRDLNFVKDIVDAFLRVASTRETVGTLVHAGSGTGISIGDLAKKILTLMKCEKPVVSDGQRIRPDESEVYELLANPALAKQLTGWESRISLDEGLKKTIAFVIENPDFYKPEFYAV